MLLALNLYTVFGWVVWKTTILVLILMGLKRFFEFLYR